MSITYDFTLLIIASILYIMGLRSGLCVCVGGGGGVLTRVPAAEMRLTTSE